MMSANIDDQSVRLDHQPDQGGRPGPGQDPAGADRGGFHATRSGMGPVGPHPPIAQTRTGLGGNGTDVTEALRLLSASRYPRARARAPVGELSRIAGPPWPMVLQLHARLPGWSRRLSLLQGRPAAPKAQLVDPLPSRHRSPGPAPGRPPRLGFGYGPHAAMAHVHDRSREVARLVGPRDPEWCSRTPQQRMLSPFPGSCIRTSSSPGHRPLRRLDRPAGPHGSTWR